MTSSDFLNRLAKEGKLELVEPSLEIEKSYAIKAENCLKSANVLLKEGLYENSITEAYYAMYNSTLSLLFRCGIKSENHTASILLLGKVFGLNKLERSLSKAKKERIDRQYYISDLSNIRFNEASAVQMIKDAEQFILEIRVYLEKLNTTEIERLRKRFKQL